MRLTRTRGLSRYAQTDFDQERAALKEGYQNYAQEAAENINGVLSCGEYTTEQKKLFLQALKADLMQKNQEYREEMRQLGEAEAQYRGDPAAYCDFSDSPLPQLRPSPANYCGTAVWESSDDGRAPEHEQAGIYEEG